MKTLSIIHNEHRNLGTVLFCLSSLIQELDEHDVKPDLRVFHAIVNYIDSFLDKYHHPKEDDYLFPAIKRCYPEAEPVLAELQQQHIRGATLLHDFREALAAYEYQGKPAFIPFRDAARTLIEFQREHVRKEETEVLPLAREHLQPTDWDTIDRAFAEHQDPLFGDQPKKEFEQLYSTIVTLAPAPHGFGPEWQPTPQ